ncbi:MAG TPA: response regulator transcription factor [Syntrophorhabdales bacterium]|nr:response regulator transcription factor [Syntrophorhabdales bacterium]
MRRDPSGASEIAKGSILVDLGSAVVADAVSHLLQTYGYESYTRESLPRKPDVIIVDSSTIDKKTAHRYPQSKLLLLETDAQARKTGRAVLFQKVRGIISCTTDSAKFKKALDAIIDGQVWIDNGTTKNFLADADLISNRGQILSFTPQEKTIAASICQGETNKEIAQKLNISVHTVKVHLRNMLAKAGAVNRSHLASILSTLAGEEKQGEAP